MRRVASTAAVPMMVPLPTMLPVRTVTVLAPGKLAVPAMRHSAFDVRNCVPAVMVTMPGMALTTMSLVELNGPLVTVRRNVSLTNASGMVNVGLAVFAPSSATVGEPAICVHENVARWSTSSRRAAPRRPGWR